MLSTEEIRRWCRSKTRRGQGKYLREFGREFATMAFLRHVGVRDDYFYDWLLGKATLSLERQRRIAKFIEHWEAGLIEFQHGKNFSRVVHRKTPRPMGTRASVDFASGAPRLRLIAKPAIERMPSFPDVGGAFDRKR